MSKKWETETLVKIKREFTQIEKYKILVDSHTKMEQKVENYKAELVKLREKYVDLKHKYSNLTSKI